MIISSVTPLAFHCKDSTGISSAGLFQCMRELHLFVNKAYEQISGEGGFGKALLLNQSLSKSKEVIDNSIVRNSNSMILLLNFYDFDVEFIGTSKNYLNSYFTLNNAFSNSETIDYNEKRHFRNGTSIYKNLAKLDSSIHNDFMNSIEYRNIVIPKPKYYNVHQMDKSGEYEGGLNEFREEFIYQGKELIDRGRTDVYLHDLSQWDAYLAKFMDRDDMFEYRQEVRKTHSVGDGLVNVRDNFVNPHDITDVLFQCTAPSMIEGLVYAYDTSGKYKTDRNPDSNAALYGIPNRPLTTPFARYRMADNLNANVKHTLDMMETIGMSLEKEYGNLDLFYCPQKHGDRVKIVFNDYEKKNQPILKYRDGTSVDRVLKSRAIDNDVENYILSHSSDEFIKQMHTDSMNGYIDFIE